MLQCTRNYNDAAPSVFERKVMEKINRNFLNDDFFRKMLEVSHTREYSPDKNSSQPGGLDEAGELADIGKTKLFEGFIEFARECYIHGITVGMNAAIEIYEENN